MSNYCMTDTICDCNCSKYQTIRKHINGHTVNVCSNCYHERNELAHWSDIIMGRKEGF